MGHRVSVSLQGLLDLEGGLETAFGYFCAPQTCYGIWYSEFDNYCNTLIVKLVK